MKINKQLAKDITYVGGTFEVPSWAEDFENKFSNQPDYYKKEFKAFITKTIKSERKQAVGEVLKDITGYSKQLFLNKRYEKTNIGDSIKI